MHFVTEPMTPEQARLAARRAFPDITECEQCGATEHLRRHHPDILNAPLYIIPLCQKCHSRLHAQLRLKDKLQRNDLATRRSPEEVLTIWVRLKGEERINVEYMREKEKRSLASLARVALAHYHDTFHADAETANADDDAA